MRLTIFIYIMVSFFVSFLIRVLPLTLIRKPITNPFVCSFLYYVPYVTLAVMTFPAILEATQSIYSGLCAMVVGMVLAWNGKSLPIVAGVCCLSVFFLEMVLI